LIGSRRFASFGPTTGGRRGERKEEKSYRRKKGDPFAVSVTRLFLPQKFEGKEEERKKPDGGVARETKRRRMCREAKEKKRKFYSIEGRRGEGQVGSGAGRNGKGELWEKGRRRAVT